LTNVNFDQDRFPEYIKTAIHHRDAAKQILEEASRKLGKPLDDDLNHGIIYSKQLQPNLSG
jgi:hydroxylamine reductase (hybrid-cluster protein)